MQDQKQIINEHLQHNSSSDTEQEVRNRRRMSELERQHNDNQPQMSNDRDSSWDRSGSSPDQQHLDTNHQMQQGN